MARLRDVHCRQPGDRHCRRTCNTRARNVAEANYIDQLVNEKLKSSGSFRPATARDETFLRRAYLDIVGVLPTPEEYERFVSNTAPNKREQLVDELLGRKEFTELWVMKWAELLQIRTNPTNQVSYKTTLLYFNWLQDQHRQQRADQPDRCRS